MPVIGRGETDNTFLRNRQSLYYEEKPCTPFLKAGL